VIRLVLTVLAASALLSAEAPAAVPVDEHVVHELAAQLRCVVCQTLSVADSPSETAHQMQSIIRERLAAGESPEQVKAYLVPFAGLGAGLVLVLVLVRRWSRRPAPAAEGPRPDAAMRERILRAMAEREP